MASQCSPARGAAACFRAPGRSSYRAAAPGTGDCARRRRDHPGLAREDARLWAAEKFVAAERHEVRARRRLSGRQRLLDAAGAQIDEAAAAQVFVNGHAALRARASASSAKYGPGGEPVMRKLLGCTRSSRRVRSLMAPR